MMEPLTPGMQIGRFVLEAKAGQGGMGVVYRAFDPALNRPVALKLLAGTLGREENAISRFRREATIVANLRHPHIATVYEFGEHQGHLFIAFEWITGQTLSRILDREGHLPLGRALRLFDQVGSALDYAHSRGVIHRDVKPGNIIVDFSDHATIVDFGLSWISSTPSITTTGDYLGTPRYTAPEQIKGEEPDGRADLYSLAVVLYEMLAGRPPFYQANSFALLHEHLNKQPPPVTEFNGTIPPTVANALNRALAKKPEDRFPTAAAFSAALHPYEPWRPHITTTDTATTVEQDILTPARLPLTTRREDVPTGLTPTVVVPPPLPEPIAKETLLQSRLAEKVRSMPKVALGAGVLLIGVFCLLTMRALGDGLANAAATETGNMFDLTVTLTIEPGATEPLVDNSTLEPAATEPIIDEATPDLPTEEPAPTPSTEPSSTPEDTPAPPPPTLTPITPVPFIPPIEGGTWFMTGGNVQQTNFVNEGLGQLTGIRWYRTPLTSEGSELVVGAGTILFNRAGVVRALEWGNGLTLWEVSVSATVIGPPALFLGEANLVLVATDTGELVALNLADGSEAWRVGNDIIQGLIYSGVTVNTDGVIYAVTDTGWFHAIDAYTGTVYWTFHTGLADGFIHHPTVGSIGFYLAGVNQALYAYYAETLELAWIAETLGIATTPPLVVENLGLVLAGTDQGWINAFAADTGGRAAALQVSSSVVGLATDGNMIYATVTDGNVYAWDGFSSEPIWVLNSGAPLHVAPLTDGTIVVVGTEAGDILFIEAATGLEIVEYRLSLGDPILFTPTPAGRWLFVRAGNLYGISP